MSKYWKFIKKANPKLKLQKGTLHTAVGDYILADLCYTYYRDFYDDRIDETRNLPESVHTFEDVLEAVINYPESFHITSYEDDYSMQERLMLKELQETLLHDANRSNHKIINNSKIRNFRLTY